MDLEIDMIGIKKLLEDFYKVTGFGIYIYFKNDEYVSNLDSHSSYCYAIRGSKKGYRRCKECNKKYQDLSRISRKPEIYACHGGLMNFFYPLYIQSHFVGFVSAKENFRSKPYEEIYDGIADLEFDRDKMKDFYLMQPEYDKERFESFMNLVPLICDHIIISNMVKHNLGKNFERAKIFILDNLNKELSVEKIAKGTNISKSELYRLFAQNCNCTVNGYVNRKRIEHAAKIMISTDRSISEIIYEVGFNNATHFYNIFKKIYNMTPTKYRKLNSALRANDTLKERSESCEEE